MVTSPRRAGRPPAVGRAPAARRHRPPGRAAAGGRRDGTEGRGQVRAVARDGIGQRAQKGRRRLDLPLVRREPLDLGGLRDAPAQGVRTLDPAVSRLESARGAGRGSAPSPFPPPRPPRPPGAAPLGPMSVGRAHGVEVVAHPLRRRGEGARTAAGRGRLRFARQRLAEAERVRGIGSDAEAVPVLRAVREAPRRVVSAPCPRPDPTRGTAVAWNPPSVGNGAEWRPAQPVPQKSSASPSRARGPSAFRSPAGAASKGLAGERKARSARAERVKAMPSGSSHLLEGRLEGGGAGRDRGGPGGRKRPGIPAAVLGRGGGGGVLAFWARHPRGRKRGERRLRGRERAEPLAPVLARGAPKVRGEGSVPVDLEPAVAERRTALGDRGSEARARRVARGWRSGPSAGPSKVPGRGSWQAPRETPRSPEGTGSKNGGRPSSNGGSPGRAAPTRSASVIGAGSPVGPRRRPARPCRRRPRAWRPRRRGEGGARGLSGHGAFRVATRDRAAAPMPRRP